MQSTLILSCSHRVNSVSKQVGEVCQQRIVDFFPTTETRLFDFAAEPLPMWDEGIWNQDPKWVELLAPLTEAAQRCDSLIVITPEYAGMASPVAKNVMLFLSTDMVGHKPAFLISVSAGIGGSYPITEMRMSSYKNNRILWLPDHAIIRSASDFKAPFEDRQESSLQRVDYGIKMLNEYAKALPAVRQSEAFKQQSFPFGM